MEGKRIKEESKELKGFLIFLLKNKKQQN